MENQGVEIKELNQEIESYVLPEFRNIVRLESNFATYNPFSKESKYTILGSSFKALSYQSGVLSSYNKIVENSQWITIPNHYKGHEYPFLAHSPNTVMVGNLASNPSVISSLITSKGDGYLSSLEMNVQKLYSHNNGTTIPAITGAMSGIACYKPMSTEASLKYEVNEYLGISSKTVSPLSGYTIASERFTVPFSSSTLINGFSTPNVINHPFANITGFTPSSAVQPTTIGLHFNHNYGTNSVIVTSSKVTNENDLLSSITFRPFPELNKAHNRTISNNIFTEGLSNNNSLSTIRVSNLNSLVNSVVLSGFSDCNRNAWVAADFKPTNYLALSTSIDVALKTPGLKIWGLNTYKKTLGEHLINSESGVYVNDRTALGFSAEIGGYKCSAVVAELKSGVGIANQYGSYFYGGGNEINNIATYKTNFIKEYNGPDFSSIKREINKICTQSIEAYSNVHISLYLNIYYFQNSTIGNDVHVGDKFINSKIDCMTTKVKIEKSPIGGNGNYIGTVNNSGNFNNNSGDFTSNTKNLISNELSDFITLLTKLLDVANLKEEIIEELKAEKGTLEAQKNSPKPKPAIIKSALDSVKKIVEGLTEKTLTENGPKIWSKIIDQCDNLNSLVESTLC